MKTNRFVVFALILLTACVVAQAQMQRPRLGTVHEDRYQVQPGDVLEVQYRYSPEFNQTMMVQPDGYVSLQVGGDLKVAGKNVEQVGELILRKVSERLKDPEAAVIVAEFQEPDVVVGGEGV